MAYEVETKVLGVDSKSLVLTMEKLGAKNAGENRLIVDWYGPKGLTHNGDDPWFLRIRSYSGGRSEITWKGQSDVLGASRKHHEVNLPVLDHGAACDLFESLGFEHYAHQEKDRVSWKLRGWRFDLDQYPGMPAYLEIEGDSELSIQEALGLLNLQGHKTSSEGERVLIKNEYGLDWFNMKF